LYIKFSVSLSRLHGKGKAVKWLALPLKMIVTDTIQFNSQGQVKIIDFIQAKIDLCRAIPYTYAADLRIY